MKNRYGFTIVELLIVIVVIAILASISIVAYNGIQSRANDSKTVAGANQFEKSLYIWAADHDPARLGGSTSSVAVSAGECANGSSGWASTAYVCNPEDALISAGLLQAGFVRALPKNPIAAYASAGDGRYSMMLYACSATTDLNDRILMWSLNSPSASDAAKFDEAWHSCGNTAAAASTSVYYTSHGMRGGTYLQL